MDDRQLIEKLTKFIGHDIAAPLANTRSYHELLKRPGLSDADRDLILQKMEENTTLAQSMIRTMVAELKTRATSTF